MDPTAFAIVKSEVRRLPFVEDKIQAVVYAQGNLYAEQVGDLLVFDVNAYDDDRMRFLQAAAAKMLPASCLGIITILRAFRSDSKKVQAVQLLSRHITDPLNFQVWNEVFPYQQERDTVRGIMTRQASSVPPAAPTTTVQYAGNPYPHGRPRPRVNPDDPVYKLVDKSVDVVASGISAAANVIAPRPSHRGAVVARPGAVIYQTTAVNSYPNVAVVNPAPGVQVIQTGPPPPPGAVRYTVVNAPPPPYPQQQYYRK